MRNSYIDPMDFLVAHAKMDAEKKASQWTTEAPTKQGYYWAYSPRKGSWGVVLVEYIPYLSLGKQVKTIKRYEYRRVDYFTYWQGPLPEPEPPTP